MANTLINWIVMALAVLAASYVLPGVSVSGFGTALIVALALGILNTFIRPVLMFLALPINILTLGLFSFVINAILIMITAAVVPGFKVESFWKALLFAVVLAVIMAILSTIF